MAFPDGWNYKFKFTTSGAFFGGEWSDAPFVLTHRTLPQHVFANARSDGGDIRITSGADGSGQQSIEIVRFESSASAEIWFASDQWWPGEDNEYYFWYGNSSATAEAVDDLWANNSIVYHGGTSAGEAINSSDIDVDPFFGTLVNVTETSGHLNSAFDFDIDSDAYIDDINDFGGENDMTEFSIEFIMKLHSIPGGTEFYSIFSSDDPDGGGKRINIGITENAKLEFDLGSNYHEFDYVFSTDTEYHVLISFQTEGDLILYVNGVEEQLETVAGETGINTTRNHTIGATWISPDFENFFDGTIDEFRFWDWTHVSGHSTSALYSAMFNEEQFIQWDAEPISNLPTGSGDLIVSSPVTELSGTINSGQLNIDTTVPYTSISGTITTAGISTIDTGFVTTTIQGIINTGIIDIDTIVPYTSISGTVVTAGSSIIDAGFVVTTIQGSVNNGAIDIDTGFVVTTIQGIVNTGTMNIDVTVPYIEASGQLVVSGQAIDVNIPNPYTQITGTLTSGVSDLLLPGLGVISVGTINSISADIYIPATYIDAIVKQFNHDMSIYMPWLRINIHGEIEKFTLPVDPTPEEIKQPKWAIDIHKKAVSVGKAYNDDAINQSIENIIATLRGERIFNPRFGTILPIVPFEVLDYQNAVDLLDIIVRAIRRWEKRIIVLENQIELNVLTEENALTIQIPYVVRRSGLTSTFSRKINL